MFLPLPQQRALQQNQLLSVGNVTAGKFNRGNWRKYHEAHLEHGFTYSTTDGKECQQCLICCKILAYDGMKPTKLVRQFLCTVSVTS